MRCLKVTPNTKKAGYCEPSRIRRSRYAILPYKCSAGRHKSSLSFSRTIGRKLYKRYWCNGKHTYKVPIDFNKNLLYNIYVIKIKIKHLPRWLNWYSTGLENRHPARVSRFESLSRRAVCLMLEFSDLKL